MSIAAALLLIYLSGPVIASVYRIGNRAGPKIYPMWLHETIYLMTWELTSDGTDKPRIAFFFDRSQRPWFYGGYSVNDDPTWIQAQIEKHRLQK